MSEEFDQQVDEAINEAEQLPELKTPDQVKVSEEHKAVITRVHEILSERDFSFYDSQRVLTLALAALQSGDSPIKSLDTAGEICQLFADKGVDKIMAKILCEILATKINEQINEVQMKNIKLSPIQ